MYSQTKLLPNEFSRLILKARGPRRGALGLGAPVHGPAASTAAIGQVTPVVGPRTADRAKLTNPNCVAATL